MARVSAAEVREIITLASSLDLSGFIASATALTDYVSSQDANSVLGAALLKEIERNLAAHFAAFKDQQYATKSTDGASANWQTGAPGAKPFEQNDWGKAAMALDVTGALAGINRGGKVKLKATWLGKAPSDQTDYLDRD